MVNLTLFALFATTISFTVATRDSHNIRRISSDKVRGVNLGSLFIIEPWMTSSTWKDMGCGDAKSEWDCVVLLGQDKANAAFQKHWNTFITADDFIKMRNYGLNTVRIPVGHWLVEETILPEENWPRGGMKYLDKIADLAASHNISVILDLHGAPGVQVSNNAFTGHTISDTGFYAPSNYDRAYAFLLNITDRIHTSPSYRTVTTLELLNEPEPSHASLVDTYYPTAYTKIRALESTLHVPASARLTLQVMSSTWGAGNPLAHLSSAPGLAFDNHRYLTYSDTPATKSDYLKTSCSDTFDIKKEKPLVTGEWSLAVKQEVEWSDEFSPLKEENHAWYRQWWAAQVQAYEKEAGWVFWNWKTELGGDWRWSYSAAVEAGIVPQKQFAKVKDTAKC